MGISPNIDASGRRELTPYEILGIPDPSDEEYNVPKYLGYQTPEEVLHIMMRVASYKKEDEALNKLRELGLL